MTRMTFADVVRRVQDRIGDMSLDPSDDGACLDAIYEASQAASPGCKAEALEFAAA